MILLGVGSDHALSMNLFVSSAAAQRLAISVLYALVCSPSASPCLNTSHPWMYPIVPFPDFILLSFFVSELSELTISPQSSSSIALTTSLWLLVQSSFDEWAGVLVGRKIWTLSGMSISISLHGGSGCGFVHSVSCRVLLLILVTHVVNFILGLLQCFLVLL